MQQIKREVEVGVDGALDQETEPLMKKEGIFLFFLIPVYVGQ